MADLGQVFKFANDETERRLRQKADLQAITMAGPGRAIIAAMENIATAAHDIQRSYPWYKRLSEEATNFFLRHFKSSVTRDAEDQHYQQTFTLNQGGNLGHGVAVTFRDDGQMRIALEDKQPQLIRKANDPLYYGARMVTTAVETYKGTVSTFAADKQIGVFLALAVADEAARKKLQTATAALPAAAGPKLQA